MNHDGLGRTSIRHILPALLAPALPSPGLEVSGFFYDEDEVITPNYYGILPSTVRYDSNLNMSEKVLYTELSALTDKYGYCFASNAYFANLYKVTIGTVSGWFSSLEKAGHIRIEVNKKAGNKRKVWTMVKNDYRYSEISEEPSSEIPEDNTTSINIKTEKENMSFKEIVEYLNLKANTAYRPATPKTKDLIRARFNEGFLLEDFKQVIDNKVKEWGDDEKMKIYLRPVTLFGTKFESYLQQGTKKKRFKDMTLQEKKDEGYFLTLEEENELRSRS